jgi:hypothetical protein
LTTRSGEHRIPTESFLLPGQQGFCVKPWEIANLPRASTAARVPPPPSRGNTLDDDAALPGDPCAGWEIGPCEIIRRLSPGSVKVLLAIRDDAREGSTLVVLRRIDLPDGLAQEIQTHAEWAWRFRHPNLSRVFKCEASDEGIFWVSERTSGATLAELGEACRKLGKGLPVGLALSAIHEAALGLGELHVPSGFSHGLISDHSVAVAFDGTTRLQDVGMFKCIARQNSWGEVLETVGPYLAPEQILSGHMPDAKCDVYSLGAVLYECLSGQRLARTSSFDERVKKQANATYVPPSSLNVSLTKELDEVVARAMNPDRAQRYEDSLEFAHALKTAASSFMWRSELRADFVAKLFPMRKSREQVLLERCAPKRSLTSPELKMPVIVPPALPPLRPVPLRVAPGSEGATVVRPKMAVAKVAPRAPGQTRALLLTLAASALAWVAWSGVVPTDYEAFVAPPPAPFVAAAVIAPLPPPPVVLPEIAAPLMCVDETPAQVVAPAAEAVEAPVVLKAVRKSVRSVKRKKASEEIPDAPWLTATPKRGRR